ncbi:hypothetical protein PSUB009319_34200 [Ralstonia sp. SET104]|nr:hypothetical protein PSUB009319_34200 [Ralstonia sp. SET104]
MALQQVEIQRDHAIRAAQPGADHALLCRAIHLLDAHDGAARGCGARGSIHRCSGFVRMAMIVGVMGGVPCDRVLMTAATAAAGGFWFCGVVLDR